MKCHTLPHSEITEQVLGRLTSCSDRAGSRLAFHRPELPTTWWKHFNSCGGEPFSRRRGRNFLGAQSWLTDFHYVVAREGDEILGAVPVASYSLRLPDRQSRFRMLALAGDSVLAPYQDFLVVPSREEEAMHGLVHGCIQLMRAGHEMTFLGYIPEGSPSIAVMDRMLAGLRGTVSWRKCTTSRKGGVHPWTLEPAREVVRGLERKIGAGSPLYDEVHQIAEDLARCTSETLLFPRNRMEIEQRLRELMVRHGRAHDCRDEMESLGRLLAPSPIAYPYIDLPGSREGYLDGLGKKTRFNFRYYRKKLLDDGGHVEKVPSSSVSADDISDYLDLHMKRWGTRSVAISDRTRAFHVDLCSRAAQKGFLTLFFVRSGDRRIAAHACFDIRGRREAYFTGMDPDYERTSAGMVLFMETILDAIDSGFSRYELGYGGDEYKFRFTGTAARSCSYFIADKGFSMPDLDRIFLGYECMVEDASPTGSVMKEASAGTDLP